MTRKFMNRLLAGILIAGMAFLSVPMTSVVMADEYDYDDDYDDDDYDYDDNYDYGGYQDNDGDGHVEDDIIYNDNQQHNTYQPAATLTGGIADSTLIVGNTTCASVSVVSSNISDTGNLRIEWSSQNPGIASVSGSGSVVTIKANSPGTCGISASLYYQGQVMDAYFGQVTVTGAPTPSYVSVSGISISKTSVNLGRSGDTTDISASVMPANANNKGIRWNSNNTSVATVENGRIRAVSSGTTIITATSDEGGFPAYCTVTVGSSGNSSVMPTSLSLNLKSVNLGVGQYMKLLATVCPDNAGNKLVRWATSDNRVASVDSNGLVTATGIGECLIYCATEANGIATSAAVHVGAQATAANTGFVTVANVVDPYVNYDAMTKIMNAKKKGTVTINSTMPKSFDINVANAMNLRKDVKVECVFPFNGHNFKLTIPKGYNLSKTFNAAGYVEWLDLCKLNGIGGITVQMLN